MHPLSTYLPSILAFQILELYLLSTVFYRFIKYTYQALSRIAFLGWSPKKMLPCIQSVYVSIFENIPIKFASLSHGLPSFLGSKTALSANFKSSAAMATRPHMGSNAHMDPKLPSKFRDVSWPSPPTPSSKSFFPK